MGWFKSKDDDKKDKVSYGHDNDTDKNVLRLEQIEFREDDKSKHDHHVVKIDFETGKAGMTTYYAEYKEESAQQNQEIENQDTESQSTESQDTEN